ncbi:TPA: phage holin family protein [Escherichia coli]|nr:phage holin family protein [Escherichia coli]HDH7615908.1 phage holin family protein [Escherichia coli]
MNPEKHTTWLAYLWAVIAGYFSSMSLDDWGALVGIVLAVGTFLVNRHYKRRTAAAQDAQVEAMRQRNRILAQIAGRVRDSPDSTLKTLVSVSEEPEGYDGGDRKD